MPDKEKKGYDWEEVCLGSEFFEACAREYYDCLLPKIAATLCVSREEEVSRTAPAEYDIERDPEGLLADMHDASHPGEALSRMSILSTLGDVSAAVSEFARTGMRMSASAARELATAVVQHQLGEEMTTRNSKIRGIAKKMRVLSVSYDFGDEAIQAG